MNKDTVYLPPNGRVKLLVRLTHYSDAVNAMLPINNMDKYRSFLSLYSNQKMDKH